MNDTEELMQAALAHHHASRLAQAEAGYRCVLELDGAHLAATYNLGIVLRSLGRGEEALACFARAAELEPQNADAQYGLGHMLRDEDRLEEAARSFRRALALRPDFAQARWSLALCTLPRVLASAAEGAAAREAFSRELEALDAWFAARPLQDASSAVAVVQPFNLAYQEESNRAPLERYGSLCSRLMAGRQPARAPRRARGAVQVGIVSAHFRHHSVWHAIMKGWLEHLDRSRIALHGFYLGTAQDEHTEFARSRCETFVSGEKDWAGEIGARGLDALIYPELGMDTPGFRLASLRLAPLQAVSWGHPETSGLPTVDCYLSAELMEPPDAERHYSERLVRLPNLGC
ncbi:MAG: tetratricopeptide repeat protein, partial [Betaproteobacteria bacterium]